MFKKPEFRNYLRFRKNYNPDKFKIIAGNRSSFTIDDVIPALREMAKNFPAPLPSIDFQKSQKHVPTIKNGAISFEEFSDYVQQCADDRNQYFDSLRLKKMLMKSSWRAMRVTDQPLTLTPTIIARVSEILAAL